MERFARRQRGAALAYVLGLLAILSFLVGSAWRMIRADNLLAARARGESQARLLAQSGLDYALSRIGPPGPAQDLGYAAEGLEYRLDDSGSVFRLSVRSRGLYGRAVSTGVSPLPVPGIERAKAALIGQEIDLSRLPALGLLNHEGNLVLAGRARVDGPVLLWRGSVRKATDYHVRFQGGAGHTGTVLDSTAVAWGLAVPDVERPAAWMEAQARMLAAGDFAGDADYDSGAVSDLALGDSGLVSGALENARISGGFVRVGDGARLKGCKIVARRLRIEAGSSLEGTIAYAQGNLEVTGGSLRGGQFLAGDSLTVSKADRLEGHPFFLALGGIRKRADGDSSVTGALRIVSADGEGVFVSACRESPAFDQAPRLVVEAGARLKGFLYTPCHARIEGEVRGSVLCRNLRFEKDGTIWLGHLLDARLASAEAGTRIPAPLMFRGLAPAAYPEAVP